MRKRSPRGSVLVLDEIQKIEGWSETVKGLWDADRLLDCPLRLVILGSAPAAHAVGAEREPRRPLRDHPRHSLVLRRDVRGLRL